MITGPRRQAPAWLLPSLAVLLLFSGICALIYQVLWLRLLALTFGVTVHAAAIVLSSFMGGLALGSLLAGRLADRTPRPLRLFGLVELSIGLCALATPAALGAVQQAFVAAAPHLPDSFLLGTLIRVVLSFLVLLLPTALMGATLPIVIKSSLAGLDGLGTRISVLYATNTAGAIVGALLAGFYLIPQIGLTRSFLLAAAINSSVGLIAIALSRQLPLSDHQPGAEPAPAAVTAAERGDRGLVRGARVVLLVSAISGFASLALEVIWFRVLAIFLGPTSYTFTMVLAAVLTGIALGSALAAPIMRWRRLDWLQVLALLQFAGAALVLASFSGLIAPGSPPAWLQRLMNSAGVGFALPAAALSLTVVLPTSIFFGVAFPIGLRLWASAGTGDAEAGRRVGVFYSVNVGGAILGSLAAGFVLLPLLGSRTSLIAMAALYLLAGIALQVICAPRRPLVTGLTLAAVIGILLQVQAVPDALELMQRRIYPGSPVVWQEEGPQTTVAVVGAPNSRVMFLDGRHQANDSPAMSFIHRRIGILPAVLHHNPRRALVIGLGGGATAGGLTQYPGLMTDVVELSEGVVKASAFFSHMNFDILNHPNVRIRVDDGRNVLQRVQGQYDVVTADAIIPRHAGANSLNSVEYFRLVRQALAPGGVALHWNGGQTTTEYQLILRAFVEVFPLATLWGDGSLMVGTLQPLTVSQERIEGMLSTPSTRALLALMQIESFDHLQRMFKASPDDIRAYLGQGSLLSDDKPLLEYYESLPPGERDLSALGRTTTGLFVR